MAAKASKRDGAKLVQKWVEQTFAEHWRERLRSDKARPVFVPKPKKLRAKKKR